jgi:rubrerythrin
MERIINESILCELDTFKIYNLFKDTFEEDAEFWKRLAEEELDHAVVLRKSKSFYKDVTDIADIISVEDFSTFMDVRQKINKLLEEFKENPTREKAFDIALQIEKSAVEDNYQKFMNVTSNNDIADVLRKLNGEEKNHIERLKKYFGVKEVL